MLACNVACSITHSLVVFRFVSFTEMCCAHTRSTLLYVMSTEEEFRIRYILRMFTINSAGCFLFLFKVRMNVVELFAVILFVPLLIFSLIENCSELKSTIVVCVTRRWNF